MMDFFDLGGFSSGEESTAGGPAPYAPTGYQGPVMDSGGYVEGISGRYPFPSSFSRVFDTLKQSGRVDAILEKVISEPETLSVMTTEPARFTQRLIDRLSDLGRLDLFSQYENAIQTLQGSLVPAPQRHAVGLLQRAGNYLLGISSKVPEGLLRNVLRNLGLGLGVTATGAGVGSTAYYGYQLASPMFSSIIDGLKKLNPFVNREIVTSSGESTVIPEVKQAYNQIVKTILSAPSVQDDEKTLRELFNIRDYIKPTDPMQIGQLQGKIEDSSLSILKRRLQEEISDIMLLKEFTTPAMKRRALQPAIGRPQLVGYPSRIIPPKRF